MTSRVDGNQNLLNSGFGLGDVLDRPQNQTHLPKNLHYVPVGNTNVRLDNMYKKGAVNKHMLSKAKPNIENPDELDPANFSMNFDNAVEKRSNFDTPATNAFANEVSTPLQDNQMLLKIYKGFMVGG